MANSFLKELPELVEAQVLSAETAENIRAYYHLKKDQSENRLFLAFGILGALISGLGIILIIAHNWDDFALQTKTLLAFVPLLLGQLACAFALFKRAENQNWREGAATFLFLAIGATISLISQVYHIPGNLSGFLLTWILLGLPLIYLMQSGMVSLLYIAGITWYATQTGYWTYGSSSAWPYWPLLVAALPFYILLSRRKKQSNFLIFHNWLLPISVIIALGTVAKSTEEFMYIAYLSLFGLFYQLGNAAFFETPNEKQNLKDNGFLTLGLAGTLIALLMLSFESFWLLLSRQRYLFPQLFTTPEFISALLLTLLAATFLFRKIRAAGLAQIPLTEVVFLVFPVTFAIGYFVPVAGQIIINLLVLLLGITTIRRGNRLNHLGILNFGLLLIAALVACRFFDTNLSFVIRGMLFLLVGAGFFMANYYTLKNRKTS